MGLQVMKLYWDEEQFTSYVDPKGGLEELIKFSSRSVTEGMKMRVVPQSMLPLDKFVMRNEALELSGQDKIDDESLFEKLGWPKPQESAKKLYLWQQVQQGLLPADVLYPGIQEEIGAALSQSRKVGERQASEPNVQDDTQGEDPLAQGGQDAAGIAGAPPPGQEAQPSPADLASALQANLGSLS